jgi:hypothetical protein
MIAICEIDKIIIYDLPNNLAVKRFEEFYNGISVSSIKRLNCYFIL